MSLYPSLEDMKVDEMLQVRSQIHSLCTLIPPQVQLASGQAAVPSAPIYLVHSVPSATPSTFPLSQPFHPSTTGHVYPQLTEYMGMELSEASIRQNMPVSLFTRGQGLVAPLSGNSDGRKRGAVTNTVRQVVLCKDGSDKIGLRVKAVNKGVFVCLVTRGSPAALGGLRLERLYKYGFIFSLLRFGDQILQVNGENLAGYSSDKVHGILKKTSVNNIVMVVRDRPFERALTLHKVSRKI